MTIIVYSDSGNRRRGPGEKKKKGGGGKRRENAAVCAFLLQRKQMGPQRSISNLSNALFSTYFYVAVFLFWRRRDQAPRPAPTPTHTQIVISLIPGPLIVYIIFFDFSDSLLLFTIRE